jgi:GGDEF domain-containing protein
VLAERIQAEVLEALAHTPAGDGVEVAVGVAAFPEHAATAEQLRHAADQAVDAARRLGCNRVVSYAPGHQLESVAS